MKAAALGVLLALSACASGPGLGGGGMLGGRTAALPPRAAPSDVIATELAFARTARENGQWTAYREFAANGAQLHEAGHVGLVDLAGRADPAEADRWVPREVWASCDGSSVVVAGIGVDPAGNWNRFTRLWQRDEADDPYRWQSTLLIDDPALTLTRQAEARQRAESAAENADAILVEATGFIRARVAECAMPPSAPAAAPGGAEAARSRDGTLAWQWGRTASGAPSFAAQMWTDAGWEAIHAEPVTLSQAAD